MKNSLATKAPKKNKEIAVIIPVKDNQEGINRLLTSLFEKTPGYYHPRVVVVVDNNSSPPLVIPKDLFKNSPTEIVLLKCKKRGAGAARNTGAEFLKGKYPEVSWLHFIDSDCIFSEKTLAGYQEEESEAVAYQGKILSLGSDWLSGFYEKTGTLVPETFLAEDNILRPAYLVSANILVQRDRFYEIGGFNDSLQVGEDVDLGYRLSRVGKLAFAHQAEALHDFLEFDQELKNKHLTLLINRIRRYGKGERILDKKYSHLLEKFKLQLDQTLPEIDYHMLTLLYDEAYRNASFKT